MPPRLRAACLGSKLVLASLLFVSPADAQWTANGVRLTGAPDFQGNPVVTSDGAGGAIVAWRDARNLFSDPSTTNLDVYAQRITADGVIPPGWSADGVPVCTDSASQDQPSITSDGAGGAYVVWVDTRNYGTNRIDVYVQRLTAEGTIAPGWAMNGNPVCTVAGDANVPRVAPDGAGGAFVVWEDFRRTGSRNDRSQADLYAQRITPEGMIAPGWPVDGLSLCTAPGDRCCENAMTDGTGGLFIEWADGRDLVQSDLYALRITGAGEIAPGWAADGVPICTAPGHQTLGGLVPDGGGGFIVAWLDARSAPPGANPEDYYDIYAQRVTGSGSIAAGWPQNGAPICTAPDIQQGHRVVADGAGGAIVVWSDYRDRYVTASDLYGQRVLASGKIAPGWPVDGVVLGRTPGFELGSTAVADGAGGALVAFRADEFDLYAQHVTASGAIAPGWNPQGVSLSAFVGSTPVAVSDGKMGMIVAWDDSYDVFAQRVGGDFPTPILVSLVSTQVEATRVVLTWFAGAARPAGAVVYRRRPSSDWALLGAPRYEGNDLLIFEDRSVVEGRYAYRLSYADHGAQATSPDVWVTVPSGYTLALAGFSPNPAEGEPVVSFSLAGREEARLQVFDVTGRAVFAQDVGSLGPGDHLLAIGREVNHAPGVYWLRLTQGARSLTAKGLVVR